MRKVTVAFLTRTIRDLPTEVKLAPEDGVPADCVVTLDNLRTVPKVLLGAPIASLAGKRMHEVCRALAVATGCDWRVSRA
jgi:mRNA interferase MazF